MARPNNDDIDLYELLNRADELLEEKEKPELTDDFVPEFEESMETDADFIYRNAANGYGRQTDQTIRFQPVQTLQQQPVPQSAPVANHVPAPKPTQAEKAVSSIRAYNADFRNERERTAKPVKQTYDETAVLPTAKPAPAPAPVVEKPKKEKKKGGCLKKLIVPIALAVALVLVINIVFTYPKTDKPIGDRRNGVSSILLCGADVGGDRTDTMMLLYVDTVKRQAGLLSLPRDTYTVTDYGASNKLNSAYGRNGGGEEGMEVLFDYVQDTIGYRPDGYVLIELPMLQDLIDLFGGVDYDVPQDMSVDSLSGALVSLQKGMQHLDGEKALALLRFRYGYIDQDLGRQNVQKNFLKECMKQWLTVENLGKITDVLSLFKAESFTDLETKHFLWFGWNLLSIGFNNIYTDTLPGYATMIGDASYYVLYPGEVADMIQDRYNPYKVEITRDMLDIATE